MAEEQTAAATWAQAIPKALSNLIYLNIGFSVLMCLDNVSILRIEEISLKKNHLISKGLLLKFITYFGMD